jgi:hypothetical protein
MDLGELGEECLNSGVAIFFFLFSFHLLAGWDYQSTFAYLSSL